MKSINVKMNGVSPILMNNPVGVNPLHPLVIGKKALTSLPAKQKTEEVLAKISDFEWRIAIYWDDNIGLYVPNECLMGSLVDGAKMNRNGANVLKACQVVDAIVPLDIGEKQDYDKMLCDPRFRDVRSVCIKRARVIKTRPRFNTWRCEFTLLYDESVVDIGVLAMAFENAGKYCGIFDNRKNGYGRYTVIISELD